MTPNEQFLLNMRDAAVAAGHIWPEYAACEAALETAKTTVGQPPQSNFGQNASFLQGNNVFGNQQRSKPVFQTLSLQSWEMKNGQRVNMTENFIKFPDLATAFKFRMQTLQSLQSIYYAALKATTGEQFVIQVSAAWTPAKSLDDTPAPTLHPVYQFSDGFYRFVAPRWSTGTARAKTVLQIYAAHKDLFSTPTPPPTVTT